MAIYGHEVPILEDFLGEGWQVISDPDLTTSVELINPDGRRLIIRIDFGYYDDTPELEVEIDE